MNKYFQFNGRIRRTHYGLRMILSYFIRVGIIVLIFAGGMLNNGALVALSFILFVATTWFSLAAIAQRCHDMGKSGWIGIIPIYGPIICLFQEGTKGDNAYGPDPKQNNGQAGASVITKPVAIQPVTPQPKSPAVNLSKFGYGGEENASAPPTYGPYGPLEENAAHVNTPASVTSASQSFNSSNSSNPASSEYIKGNPYQ